MDPATPCWSQPLLHGYSLAPPVKHRQQPHHYSLVPHWSLPRQWDEAREGGVRGVMGKQPGKWGGQALACRVRRLAGCCWPDCQLPGGWLVVGSLSVGRRLAGGWQLVGS